MNLLLIKFGKAVSTLKREGLVLGGRRVAKSFLAMFGRVRPGDVLFVTGGVGDSARYRTGHVAEELAIHGFKCSVTIQDNPLLATYADKFSVFIFHRVIFTPSVAKLIKRIKQQNKEIIFETDDLVFDAKYLAHMDYFKQMNNLERKLYQNGVGGEILRDPYVKVCTVTTNFLADKLREYGKKVFIIPNKLSRDDVENADRILSERKSRNDGKVRIGYFSGTISHNKDFASVTPALLEIMGKYDNVELFLVGPLDIESSLNTYKDRVKQFPYVPRRKHFENVASVDINIAPLEADNPFCESKSELKFFEAGIVKVPTVASSTQTFREAIRDGEDGFVAKDTQEWIEKLSRLIENKELREAVGEKARETALLRYTNRSSGNGEYYEYLRGKMKNVKINPEYSGKMTM